MQLDITDHEAQSLRFILVNTKTSYEEIEKDPGLIEPEIVELITEANKDIPALVEKLRVD